MKRVSTFCLGLMFVVATASGAAAQAREGRQGVGRGPAAPTCTTLACDLQSDVARTRDQVTALADAMPDDKWDFKPTPAQQSFGERVMHIAQTDIALLGTLGGKTPKPTLNAQAKTKAEVMAALKQSFEFADATIKEFNDQQLMERIASMPFLGATTSRAHVIVFDLGHSMDIYGQLVVYVRLNGVTPPASRRGGI